MNEPAANRHLLVILFQNRLRILLITSLFLVAAIVLTFYVPKKYIAYGVVLPPNSNSITEIAGNPDFGHEMHADRLIQLLQSQDMKKMMVERFELIEYYHLDTASPGWRYALASNMAKDITFSRTKYLSVAIQANMRDPQLAADLVNSVIAYIDTVRERTYLSNIQLLAADYEKKVAFQQEVVDRIFSEVVAFEEAGKENRLTKTRLSQIEERYRSGSQRDGDAIIRDKLMENPSYALDRLVDSYYQELEILKRLKNEQQHAEKVLTLPFPKVYRVLAAEVDRKKVSPSLFTNAVTGLFLGLVLSILTVVFRERWKRLKSEIKA